MWQIEHQHAVWKSRRLAALVDLTRPALGLHRLRYEHEEWPDTNIHQVSFPSADADAWEFIDDAYVRENDLMVTYRESAIAALRTQLQWRVHELPDAVTLLELIASVQTPCRDCDPRIRVATSWPSTVWHLLNGDMNCEWDLAPSAGIDHVALRVATPGVVLLNSLGTARACIAQAIPASDLIDAYLMRDGATPGSTLTQTYFANRLEKGVLRRVRLQAFVTPNSVDVETVRAVAVQSLHHAPPLVV